MSPTENADDENVGDLFEDLDSRSVNRRIRIVHIAEHEPRSYRYVTVTNEGNPSTVGRHGTVSRDTLEERFRKVSRS